MYRFSVNVTPLLVVHGCHASSSYPRKYVMNLTRGNIFSEPWARPTTANTESDCLRAHGLYSLDVHDVPEDEALFSEATNGNGPLYQEVYLPTNFKGSVQLNYRKSECGMRQLQSNG
jgi:hypothetical protein